MRLLSDHDVYANTVVMLRGDGHDVITAAELKLSNAPDSAVLQMAHSTGRILLTRDRDFGALVHLSAGHGGVIYLRMTPSTQHAVHDVLRSILGMYEEVDIFRALIVVEPSRYRIRWISS